MINSFSKFLIEEEKVVYFTFGRMNPPTIGHEKLLEKLARVAGKNPYRVFLSQTQDNKKNPLSYMEKVKFARKMFPRYARSIMLNKKVKNIFDVLVTLYNEGYVNVTMVVGSDRVNEFDITINKYNGKKAAHGFYNFRKINVVSAGQRDPDAEGAEGASATKQRTAAKENDFTSFSQGLPKKVSNADAKRIFNAVRKGLGLKEETNFKNKINLEPISQTREDYVNGSLYNVGDQVVFNEDDTVGKIVYLGTNYVIVESNGVQKRRWLDSIELIEKRNPEDPDIGDRKGSQPVNYHRGLKKSTKIARDRHFKKHGKKPDNDPGAYKPAPGDANAKTKPSKYTKAFKSMYGEQDTFSDVAKRRIDREKEADRIRHDRMMDRARMRDTRKKNKETK